MLTTMSNEPTAPTNFAHVERYVSNLPIERVNILRGYAEFALAASKFDQSGLVEKLAGYILELTQENK